MSWNMLARNAICALAMSPRDFTSDDLLDLVGPPDTSHAPNARNNQIGMVFRHAKKDGLIFVVGHAVSEAPHRKRGLVRVWRGMP